MPASSLSYNNINSDSRMIPDIMRVFGVCGNLISLWQKQSKKVRVSKIGVAGICGQIQEIDVLPVITSWHSEGKVDKKWERYSIFVYLTLQIQGMRIQK